MYSSGAPAVAVGEELADDQHGGGEAERGVAVAVLAVGVSAELPVVRQPRVGRFDDPTKPERDRFRPRVTGLAATLDDVIGESGSGELSSDLGVVVAAIEVHCVDLSEPAVVSDLVDSGFEEADVVAVGAVDRPADRHTVGNG